jgi:hypothetical protein
MSRETRILIVEKDKCVTENENRPTKCILKTLLTHSTQRSNKQTSHQAIARQISLKKFEDSHPSYNYLMLT